jgi:protein pelota
MLNDPNISTQISDVKAAKEVKILQDFYKTISDDEDRACYGYDSVYSADQQLAIKVLLVTDRFFLGHGLEGVGDQNAGSSSSSSSSSNVISDMKATAINANKGNFDLRKRHVELADSVKEHGGEVYHFSSMHTSGQQLDNFTGCAAILRFPLPDLDYDDDDDDDDDGGEYVEEEGCPGQISTEIEDDD